MEGHAGGPAIPEGCSEAEAEAFVRRHVKVVGTEAGSLQKQVRTCLRLMCVGVLLWGERSCRRADHPHKAAACRLSVM
jgi:hypothetical protein